ncbi:restriction endonuclease subunit S [Enterococcus hirae]|uniref:restriction endonuclease subunit S n=1 Tax=Enterococcus hirae TaxID=1354 RepID=UPI001A972B55|nr:restriction endonuclease subunit S [Enterococcus hirae]MBO1102336.1 restriction endonuclease subunit S [Enterococcus hirae]
MINKINLAQLVEIKKGKKVVELSSFQEGAYRYIQIGDLRNNLSLKYTLDNSGVLVDNEDILIAWDGANAGTIGFGLNGVIGSTIAAIKIKPEYKKKILPTFLGQFLKGKSKLLRDKATGATIPHIQKSELLSLKLDLPTIETQKKIADTLDLASELIENRKEQIAEMDKLIQSVFYEMFLVSEGKKMKKLRDYEEFLTSGSRGWAKYYSDKGSYFITIKNVKNTRLNFEKPTFVNPPDTKEAQRTRVKANDLLISITADLGRTAVVTKEIADFGGFINQHLSLIRLSKQINPTFLSHYFESEYGKRQFEKLDQNGVKSGLNFDAIRNLEFPIFPIELQNKFASIVEGIESQKKVMEESLHEMENNFNALMQKAFRGELFPEE